MGVAGWSRRTALRHVDGRSGPTVAGGDRLTAEPVGGIRSQDREVFRCHADYERRWNGAAYDIRQAHRADMVWDGQQHRRPRPGDRGEFAAVILSEAKDPSTRT